MLANWKVECDLVLEAGPSHCSATFQSLIFIIQKFNSELSQETLKSIQESETSDFNSFQVYFY